MKWGTNNVVKAYIGVGEINKIYLGSNLLYTKVLIDLEPPVDLPDILP